MNLIEFFEKSIEEVPNIGASRKYLLNKIGVRKFKHLLLNIPLKFLRKENHLIQGDLLIQVRILKKYKVGKICIISCIFEELNREKNELQKNEPVLKEIIEMKFFNHKFLNFFTINKVYQVFGNLQYHGDFEKKSGKWEMLNAKIVHEKYETFPMYNTSISSVVINKIANDLIDSMQDGEKIYNNLNLKQALYNLHNGIDTEKSLEILKYLEASLFVQLFGNQEEHEYISLQFEAFEKEIANMCPFELNEEQKYALKNIVRDLESNKPMRHFVYGDVGSGKTIVALLSAILMVKAGYTVAFLAPTITLAQQHFETMQKLHCDFEYILLSSSSKKKEREDIANGRYKLIVGTHALLFSEIPNLGLVIIDEMQKFGVLQRAKLLENSIRKNILNLSATPIPRSLNILLEKFINFSLIKKTVYEKQITTSMISEKQTQNLIQRLCENRGKIYWVLPSIEDVGNDEDGNKTKGSSLGVVSRYEILSQFFKEIFLLHGRMKDKEKIEIINKFKNSESGILVATTIIEIGIDVPDASIIVIENANNFGLSQLHQLRGRVGRSGQQAYCVLIYKNASKKLEYLREYNDGFSIAQKDLELRGLGEWVGLRQHGSQNFSFFDLSIDEGIFQQAQIDKKIFEEFSIFFSHDLHA